MSGVGWFKNSIIYHILIDRFAGFESTNNWNQPKFLGGNIKGITKKLPYLLDLGINTIWISPFYKTTAYHGYHITDFYQVDPHFGNLDDVQDLVTECHKNNVHIIADFVPNHLSRQHPFFIDAQKNQQSKYFNWFYFTSWPEEYLSFLSIKEIPKINLYNIEAKDHIINAARYWLNQGFDGFRLDHVIGPPHLFWKEFKDNVKKEFPKAVLIGEAWMMGIKKSELKTINIKRKYMKWLFGSASDRLFKQYLGELDGVLDFRFQELIRKYIIHANLSDISFKKRLEKHYSNFPNNYFLPNFLDNHDMDRFLFLCEGNKEKLKKAAKIQFSLEQPPIIYYGTETGLSQDKSVWQSSAYGDLQARKPMNWEKMDQNLLEYYKNLIKDKKNQF